MISRTFAVAILVSVLGYNQVLSAELPCDTDTQDDLCVWAKQHIENSKSKDGRTWFAWLKRTPFTPAANCSVYHATPEQALDAANAYSERARRAYAGSLSAMFLTNYQLMDEGAAGLVLETIPPGLSAGGAPLHFFRDEAACRAFAKTQEP